MIKVAFFHKYSFGIGLSSRNQQEIGQKLDFRGFCSEFQRYIEVFLSLGLFSTSASIAQLVECLTFFL
jgi:hypothetical protein